MCVTVPVSRHYSRYMCWSVFLCFHNSWNLSVFLALSLSLSPSHSSCLYLYLNILFSMYTCLSGMWECVFDSAKKRMSPCGSLSLSLSVSCLSPVSLLSVSALSHFSLPDFRVNENMDPLFDIHHGE